MAGGGDGSEAAEADLRRFEVIELDRAWPSFAGDCGRIDFIVFVRDPVSISATPLR
jgi:hypothetical protein